MENVKVIVDRQTDKLIGQKLYARNLSRRGQKIKKKSKTPNISNLALYHTILSYNNLEKEAF